VVQSLDACLLDTDHKRARTGAMATVLNARQQVRIIVRHGDADDQRSENVEGEQTVDEALGRLGDVAPR